MTGSETVAGDFPAFSGSRVGVMGGGGVILLLSLPECFNWGKPLGVGGGGALSDK